MVEKAIEAQTGDKVDVNSNSNGEKVTIKIEDHQTQYSAEALVIARLTLPFSAGSRTAITDLVSLTHLLWRGASACRERKNGSLGCTLKPFGIFPRSRKKP
jgi:hypothetical protein